MKFGFLSSWLALRGSWMATCVMFVSWISRFLMLLLLYMEMYIYMCLYFGTAISEPMLNAVTCYAPYAISFEENTFYCNFTVIAKFSFLFHFTSRFTKHWLKQKNIFLVSDNNNFATTFTTVWLWQEILFSSHHYLSYAAIMTKSFFFILPLPFTTP